jgi:UTP-glucose-1-phosphate uridylyltransferase
MKKNNIGVKKAVILAGGLNSRMLPISKVIPKVMLPYKDKLAVQYLVEECVDSGIEKIYFVVKDDESLIQKYFQPDEKLNFLLHKYGKKEMVDKLNKIENYCETHFVKQPEPLGEADAAFAVCKVINGDPFAVLLGDTVYMSEEPAIKQLMLKTEDCDRKLKMGDSRFIFSKSAYQLFCERYHKEEDKLDKRIEDMFDDQEICFTTFSGKKIRVGELDKYTSLFVE